MRPIDFTFIIRGKRYFTVKHFAWMTKRSEQNIRFLMCYGNKQRKLKVTRINGKPFIPFEELMEFPFTMPGRNSKFVYHYTEEGVPTPWLLQE